MAYEPTRIVATELIESNTREHGGCIMDNLLPSPIDGLKKVQRRILWSIRDMPGNIPGSALVSSAIKYHPYGDTSIYDAAMRLAQPFKNTFPLIDIKGDCGTYGGDSPAGMRYVEFRLSDFTREIFLNNIDSKTFRMLPTEDLVSIEPAHFIPRIPFALINGNYAVGFGFKSWTVPYAVDNICEAVMRYSEHRAKHPDTTFWDYTQHAKLFVPHFPIEGYIRNNEHLIKCISRGDFNVNVVNDGTIAVGRDTISILTLPAYSEIDKCKDVILAAMRVKGSWAESNITSFIPLSNAKMDACLQLQIKRSCNMFEAIDTIKQLVGVTGHITPIPNYVIGKAVVNLTPPQIIQHWYRERYNSILSYKKYAQMSLSRRLTKLDISLLVCDHVKEVTQIIHDNDEVTGRGLLQERFTLTSAQAHILYGMPLSVLSRTSKEELCTAHAKLTAENSAILSSYGTIHAEIYADNEYIKKKYTSNTGSKYPSYKGYMVVDNTGIIQYESHKDLLTSLAIFPKAKVSIHTYPTTVQANDLMLLTDSVKQSGMYPDCHLPKIVKGYGIVYKPNRVKYTVCILKDTISYQEGLARSSDPDVQLTYLKSKSIIAFRNGGMITPTTVDSLALKKSICTGQKSSIVRVIDDDGIWPKVVLSMNTACANQLRLQLIDETTTKFITTSAGSTRIVDIVNLTKCNTVILNLPDDCIKSTTIKHFQILSLSELLESSPSIAIGINLSTYKRKTIKRNADTPSFVTL